MFFSNKQKSKKLDPKVRFQNRQFNQKLQQARTFKRASKPISESSVDRFLERIGLGSRLLQAGLVLLAIGILYIVYIPNFLTLQNITIEGASDSDRSSIEAAVRNTLGSAPFYNPQRNLFFVSKTRVEEAVMSVVGVDHVDKISKNYGATSLHIAVVSKYEKFLVRTNERVYDVYNDGTLKGEAGVNRDGWANVQNPNMIKVNIEANVPVQNTREFFTPSTVKYITELQENAKGIIGSSLQYVNLSNKEIQQPPEPNSEADVLQDNAENEEVVGGTLEEEVADLESEPVTEPEPQPEIVTEINLPISPGQLDVVMQKGNDPKRVFRVIVDTKESAHDLVQRLNLLLSQTSPDRYNNISYIDLRVKSRAYVCLLNSVCD